MLGGDAGHQGLRAVPSRDAEQVGALGDGRTRHLLDIDWLGAAHQEHLGAKILSLALQIELPDLPATGPRIHDQVGMRRRWLGGALGHGPVSLVTGQRQARGHSREHPHGGRGDRHPEQPGERVADDDGDRRKNHHRERRPAQYAPAGEEVERRGQGHHRARQPCGQHREASQPGEDRYDHDRQGCERKTQARKPALRARALSGGVQRHTVHVRHGRAPAALALHPQRGVTPGCDVDVNSAARVIRNHPWRVMTAAGRRASLELLAEKAAGRAFARA